MHKVQRRVEPTAPQLSAVRGGFCGIRGPLAFRHRVLVPSGPGVKMTLRWRALGSLLQTEESEKQW
jgi:hypothetical protein